MIDLLSERIRRLPPRSQEDCIALAVRQSLAALGETHHPMRACLGIARGLFGEAWDGASGAQKMRWLQMTADEYRRATAKNSA